MDKKTVIVGSTPRPYRYAHQAAVMFDEREIPFVPLGIQEGEVLGRKIENIKDKPQIEEVDTLTMYIGAARQKEWYDYLLSLEPRRIIFNPGSENFEFKQKAEKQGVECLEACTLVMLSIGNF